MEFVNYTSKEEYESYKNFLNSRLNTGGGCVSYCICPNCYAKFYDSICCCVSVWGFLCSKCGVDSTLKSRLSTVLVNPRHMADIKIFGTPEQKPLDNRS